MEKNLKNSWTRLGMCLLLGLFLWYLPVPQDITPKAWHFLTIFVVVIVSFLINPFPMGPMVILGLVTLTVTQTMELKDALAGYGDSTVWLVVAAFLMAGAVRRTGLGRRLALILVCWLGKSTLGLGYALCGAELLLGPVVPSNTARGGGIIAPIMRSLAEALESYPNHHPKRAGEYLSLVGAHANLITAAMFLTGMAANPLIKEAAEAILKVNFSWPTWALGALAPGLLALLLLPPFLYLLAKPLLTDARPAQEKAGQELSAMGAWTGGEKVMVVTFVLLIVLWSTAPLHATLVAWIGVCILLLAGTQQWSEMVQDSASWDTLMWLGGLLAMANGLKSEGLVQWFADSVQRGISQTGFQGIAMVVILGIIYFYSMYGFSMLTAHISAMVAAFFAVSLSAHAPPLVTVAIMAYFSNLCACLTNYSTGPVIIYFGLAYVEPKDWFAKGLLVSLFHMVIWIGGGLIWWKILGWW